MIEFNLPDMTCGHCVKTVTGIVQRIDPNAKLSIDLPTHKVQIESALPAESFKVTLADEGYPAA